MKYYWKSKDGKYGYIRKKGDIIIRYPLKKQKELKTM